MTSKRKSGNGKARKKHCFNAESKCIKALSLLVNDGRLHGFTQHPVLDKEGIDFVLHVFLPTDRENKRRKRVAVHLQVKQAQPRKQHEVKQRYSFYYPNIPIFVLTRRRRSINRIADDIWRIFRAQFPKEHPVNQGAHL